jgi:hypothetical protein
MTGSSGPETSAVQLSIPIPRRAERRCSTVPRRHSPLPSVVAMVVSTTHSGRAGKRTGRPRSFRTNRIPVPADAGRSLSSTGFPLWRPMPVHRTGLEIVCSSPLSEPFLDRTKDLPPTTEACGGSNLRAGEVALGDLLEVLPLSAQLTRTFQPRISASGKTNNFVTRLTPPAERDPQITL